MKKFLVTILSVFYLGVSSGATLHFHYCKGQLVEWGTVSKKEVKCSKCGMQAASAKDCCKHQNQQLKVDTLQKLSEKLFQLKPFSIDLGYPIYLSTSENNISSLTEEFPISQAPPEAQRTPAFILHCNFRI